MFKHIGGILVIQDFGIYTHIQHPNFGRILSETIGELVV